MQEPGVFEDRQTVRPAGGIFAGDEMGNPEERPDGQSAAG